jgi:T5SS/PEP-CTERM-associated repeat protein
MVGHDSVGENVVFNNPIFTPNYNWESPLSYSYATTPTNTNGVFTFNRTDVNPSTGQVLSVEGAGGLLTATSLTVSGPGSSGGSSSGGSPPTPQITTNQFASPCINSQICQSGAPVTGSTNIDLNNPLTIGIGGTGTLSVGLATLTAPSVTLGNTNEGDGTVQSGGAISTGSLTVGGSASGAPGNLQVHGGTVNVTGDTIAADETTPSAPTGQPGGSLLLDNGASLTTNNFVIGNQPGSVGTVNVRGIGPGQSGMANTNVAVNGTIVVGNQGTGNLFINNGANVSSSALAIGSQTTSVGNVSISDAGTTPVNNGALIVGDASGGLNGQPGGSLSIMNGAAVSTAGLVVGNQSLSSGILSVGGSGTRLTSTKDVIIANNGAASLAVTGGASIMATNGADTTIAANSDSAALLTVSGLGSTFAAGSSLTIGQAPGIAPFIDSTDGGAVLLGLSNSPLGNLGGFAIGGDGSLTLTIASNALAPVVSSQLTPDILTTGALQLAGNIVLQTLHDTFITPNALLGKH